jgi:hypothetical protein
VNNYVHPEPVVIDPATGTRIWIYRDAYLFPDEGNKIFARYLAFTGRYPDGDYIAKGMTVNATVRRARRATVRYRRAGRPVDVSRYTEGTR